LITFGRLIGSDMRSGKPSTLKDEPTRPLRLLLWLTLVCSIFGYLEVGEIPEDLLRVTRNFARPRAASADVVFVAIDDRSTQEIGAWPWPRTKLAELIDRTTAAGVKGVFLQVPLENRTVVADDQQLARAIERSGKVTLAVRTRQGIGRLGQQASGAPLAAFGQHARLADISVFYNYQGAAWRAPYASSFEGQPLNAMAAAISGRSALPTAGQFRIDYSIDSRLIPRIEAADLLKGRVDARLIRGKSIVVGLDGESLGDQVWIPGRGRMGMTYVQMLGAETLKRGTPRDFGFLPGLLLALVLAGLSLRAETRRGEELPLLLGFVVLLVAPAFLEANLLFVDVFAGLAALIAMTARLAWRRWRSGSLIHPGTGLPNLTALREDRSVPDRLLVAARVHNYAEIASTLSEPKEVELVRQIVQRLSVGDQPLRVFQGDEGVFAWFTDRSSAITNHLEALHSLFRTPVSIGARPVDIALTFGVELGSSRANASRLASALVAADEAWNEGLRWKYHDPAREEEVSWRLSLLGELDAAIDKGEVWIAYQPQYDLRRGQVIGAEALARWTHPEKGPISPVEFVAAAEQQGRITKLTDFVLNQAVSTAAALNRRGTPFTIAVNISPRLLTDRELVTRVADALTRHQLPPERLTLELTETESLHSAEEGLAILDRLRALGVRIAIDDYGTGLSTLDYLKKIPATEIKIDQSFIKGIKGNRSDLIMVQSTIALAHSLGRSVVAEGVEDRATLDQLADMDCDVAQGFLIGRPMSVRELVQALHLRSIREVA